MPVKCLGCDQVLQDSEDLAYHRLYCRPYVGAVWASDFGKPPLPSGVVR